MDGHGPDHAGHLVFPHLNPFADHNARIDPADGAEAQQAVIGIAHNDEAHFIHVRGNHLGRRVRIGTLFEADEVAAPIDLHLIAQGTGGLHQAFAHRAFVARQAVQLA